MRKAIVEEHYQVVRRSWNGRDKRYLEWRGVDKATGCRRKPRFVRLSETMVGAQTYTRRANAQRAADKLVVSNSCRYLYSVEPVLCLVIK